MDIGLGLDKLNYRVRIYASQNTGRHFSDYVYMDYLRKVV